MTPPTGGRVVVVVNGAEAELDEGATVQDVVDRLLDAGVGTSSKGIAVALDREVVPRSAWSAVTVRDGARVEVVTAAAGG